MDLNRCKVCGGTEFYKEAGYYFCTECQTQNEDKREEILELHLEGTRVTKRKIPKNNSDKPDLSIQWTTWEQYNFILIGLTEELIELGVTPEIKFTVLQLWASYLGKIEVAFTSTEMKALPKLARSFHRKDADIIYGKLKSRKRKRKKGTGNSSIVSSQISEASSVRELNKYKRKMINEDYNRFASSQTSESDTSCFASQSLYSVRSGDSQSSMCERRLRYSNHAKDELKRMTEISKKLPMAERLNYRLKHVTTRYRTGPNNITPIKLWAILYLALRIHNESIHLGDMLRYAREGHLSYYRLDHLLPAEMALSDNDVKLLTQNNEITHRGMRKMCAEIAKFLFINEINCPNLMPLIYRYCKDLNLPKKISTYAERLIAVLPPKMTFNKLEPLIPNYEGRAMAFIIVIFKMLLGMDGITEYETSRIAEKINSKASVDDDQHMKLFSFREWQRHIECRRNILMRKHFPTKFKNDSDGFGNTELYVRFIKSALSRREEKPVVKNCKNTIPRDLTNAIEQCVTMIGESPQNLEDREIFPPSLTPQYSYLEQLLESPMYDLPHILRSTFDDAKVHYLTKPKKLIKFAAEYGIKLEIVNSSLHFLDKLVPQFEKSKMPSLGEWNKSVIVANQSENGDKDEYISPERKNSLVLFKLNTENQSYYDTVQKRMRNDRKNKDPGGERNSTIYVDLDESISDNFDFGFEDITCDGKLAIDSIQNWDSNDEPVMEFESKIDMENQTFYEKYNLKFPDNLITNNNEFFNEINSQNLLKSHKKKKLTRDFSGKFVKPNSASARMEPAVYKKPRKIMLCSKYSGRSFSEVEEQNPFESSNESSDAHVSGVLEQLFIPSEDYWMYHCVFSRVKPKNFESCESELPVSFQWLLNECADVVEMSTEDLYEQVCLVETHFAHILRTDNLRHNSYLSKDNQAKIRLCRKKW